MLLQSPCLNQYSELAKVVALIKSDNLVILPTDTLYALSASALSEVAVQKVFDFKKRAIEKSLPVLVSSIEEASHYCHFNELSMKVAKLFWPGSVTLLLESKGMLASGISSNNKVAMRMPNHKVLLNIIESIGHPIIGTSANIAGELYINDTEIMKRKFGNSIYIMKSDHNFCDKPSTIIDCSEGVIQCLREGVVARDVILNLMSEHEIEES